MITSSSKEPEGLWLVDQPKLAVIVGSQGDNLKLAHKLVEAAKNINFDPTLIDLVALNLPLYSSAEEARDFPKKAQTLRDLLVSSDAAAYINPEYNGGLPPSLVNAISWVSRMPDGNWRDGFARKPTMLATQSGGSGDMMLSIIRLQLGFLGAHIIGRNVQTKKPNQQTLELNACLKDLALSFKHEFFKKSKK